MLPKGRYAVVTKRILTDKGVRGQNFMEMPYTICSLDSE
ncbi:UNVERIFIED_ORG: hypothetical protein QOE_3919 [Clostridioides difficile F501]